LGYSLGTTLFAGGDFQGLPAFGDNFFASPVTELPPPAANAKITFLTNLFHNFAAGAVATMLDIYSTTRQLQDALVGALNAVILNGASLYNAGAFAGVTLSADTAALLAAN